MIGKINGENILYLNIIGVDQGWQCRVNTLVEAYNYIKQSKEIDKENHFKETAYLIQLETDKSIYGNYVLRKYKNKLSLSYCDKY